MGIYIAGVFEKNTEAGELWSVDLQVSEVAGFQAPAKAAAVSCILHSVFWVAIWDVRLQRSLNATCEA